MFTTWLSFHQSDMSMPPASEQQYCDLPPIVVPLLRLQSLEFGGGGNRPVHSVLEIMQERSPCTFIQTQEDTFTTDSD
jgi:hypothetical protein